MVFTPNTVPIRLVNTQVKLQFTTSLEGVVWPHGVGNVEFLPYTQGQPVNQPIATTATNASGAATLSLPGLAQDVQARAVLPLPEVIHSMTPACPNTLKSSHATARTLFGNTFHFGAAAGNSQGYGGPGRAFDTSHDNVVYPMLVYSTQSSIVSGEVWCGGVGTPVLLRIRAGWNIVTKTVSPWLALVGFERLPVTPDTVIKVIHWSSTGGLVQAPTTPGVAARGG